MAYGLLPVFPGPSMMPSPKLRCKNYLQNGHENPFPPQTLRPVQTLENPTSQPEPAITCHLWTTDETSPPELSSCCHPGTAQPLPSSRPPFLCLVHPLEIAQVDQLPPVFLTPASFLPLPCSWSSETSCLTLPSNWSSCFLQPTSHASTID